MVLDEKDEQILDLLKGNARMSYQELGDNLGISRVAAKKRVDRLERDGIIRGYNTCIYEPGMIIVLIDIITKPDKFEDVLKYVTARLAWIRQIYTTAKENHIHIVATPCSVRDYNYLVRMITKRCSKDAEEIRCYTVKEIIKDVYGGVGYDQRATVSDGDGGIQQV
ncbi:MAG: Lrp/AsnC family transcriptional regulator [Lachnospiraceae bacterium]|nr:Lrp/AsnC family transcriptional regulator [Lachnospiraceae bacterium]